jgi:hypothetical protein
MKNKNLLIGAGVVIAGYLIWKKIQPKKCLKWSNIQCITAPCNQTCEEYEK